MLSRARSLSYLYVPACTQPEPPNQFSSPTGLPEFVSAAPHNGPARRWKQKTPTLVPLMRELGAGAPFVLFAADALQPQGLQ
jgi:hypothetical protein